MKKILSILLIISLLAGMSNIVWAAGTVKDISEYVDDTLDFIGSTPAGESERWKSGSHNISVSGDVQAISGTGNTSNSNAVFYGLKRDGAYKFAQMFDNANGNQIPMIQNSLLKSIMPVKLPIRFFRLSAH